MDWEASEREKYTAVWQQQSYRQQADGGPVVVGAFQAMGCQAGETLIDWGCGTGRPARQFAQLGLVVTCFDIADNCLDPDIELPLVVGCLWSPPVGLESDYAFCTDVLEHIPPDKLDDCLTFLYLRTRKAAFIQVCTVLDESGPKMSPPRRLHLSVHSHSWWFEQMVRHWNMVTAGKRKTRGWFLCQK